VTPETTHTPPPPVPAGAAGRRVPLLDLVLSGALRMRHEGAEPPEPARERD
jgi:hypothetical protein